MKVWIFSLLIIAWCYTTVQSQGCSAISNGYYRIVCDTERSGREVLEAFPRDFVTRPEREDHKNQDQKWHVECISYERYRISCDTKSQGLQFLEAYPKDDLIRVNDRNDREDQKWRIEKDIGDTYRVISSDNYMEAYPRDNVIRPEYRKDTADQRWKFIPWS